MHAAGALRRAPSRACAPPAQRPNPQCTTAPRARARAVTPAFACYYEEQGEAKEVEVVFVSADNEEGEFDEYFTEMPWAAVKYAFEGREAIGEKFGVVRARPPPRQPARPPAPRAAARSSPTPRACAHFAAPAGRRASRASLC